MSGFAGKPGLYSGLSSDSLLNFIDQAQGIRPQAGSFRLIEIKRNNQVVRKVDLYEFMAKGQLAFFQFQDGDVINIKGNNKLVSVEGEVANAYLYELKS